ncbi:hypothetical protein B0H34DRAFT_800360 [Crassisporium funariophilum]|nr:hypothetical protein B0H34DRAFT_800360 [Crassisporium funariophilum]
MAGGLNILEIPVAGTVRDTFVTGPVGVGWGFEFAISYNIAQAAGDGISDEESSSESKIAKEGFRTVIRLALPAAIKQQPSIKMSLAESHRVALEWARCIVEGRFDDLAALGAPGATWWMAGLKEKVPAAGLLPFAERVEGAREFFSGITNVSFTLVGVTTEGNTAVLEGVSRGEGADGRKYVNDLLVKFVVKDGRIESVREYADWFAIYKLMGVGE